MDIFVYEVCVLVTSNCAHHTVWEYTCLLVKMFFKLCLPKKKIKFFWAESECSPRKVQEKSKQSPSKVQAKSKQSPSKVQAKSKQNPSRIENNLCLDCARTPQTMFRLCSDYSDCPRTVLRLLGLSSESARTMWGRVKYWEFPVQIYNFCQRHWLGSPAQQVVELVCWCF